MTDNVVPMVKPLPPQFFADKLANVATGMGTDRDKSYFTSFSFTVPVKAQLDAAYRADWIARKIVDVPVNDETRMWREWQAENDTIEKIEEAEKLLNVRAKLNRSDKMARLYGGALLVMGIDGAGEPDTPLDVKKVKKDSLKFVHSVSRYALSPSQPSSDLMSPWYGQPEYYEVLAGTDIEQIAKVGEKFTGVRRIHASRVVRLIGNEILDDTLSLSTDTWGDSVLTVVEEAVKNAGESGAAILNALRQLRMDVLGIPNLMNNLSTQEYTNRLTERLSYVNLSKSVWGTLIRDKEEEWAQLTTSLAGSPDLLKLYLLIASGAADIPATRMLGQSATGLGATGEGDERNYRDKIKSDQETRITPAMDTLDQVLVRSATGTENPNSYYEWASLYQMTDTEKADLAYKKAQSYQIDVNAGLVSDEALAKGRINQLIEDGTYPGLEDAIEEAGNDGLDDPEPGALETMEAQANIETKALQQRQKLLPKPKPTKDGQPTLDARNWFVIEDTWREEDHPRDPGGEDGGQFIAKGAVVSAAEARDLRDRTFKEKLSKSEVSSLRSYSGEDSGMINDALRGGGFDDIERAALGETLRGMDSAFAKAKLPSKVEAYRVVSISRYNKFASMKDGTTFTDKAFVSTTMSRTSLKRMVDDSDVGDSIGIVKINVPKGYSAIALGGWSEHEFERELLLKRGSKFKLQRRRGQIELDVLK